MEVCKEMAKLRKWLDDKNIEWEDYSEDIDMHCDEVDFWMCRTRFKIRNKEISVINGMGSYGGFFLRPKENQGLLEIMGLFHEVVGYYTAEDLIEILEDMLKK